MGLLMVANQQLPAIKAMPLGELFAMASVAAAMTGRKFDPP